jgi:hypothetical protein
VKTCCSFNLSAGLDVSRSPARCGSGVLNFARCPGMPSSVPVSSHELACAFRPPSPAGRLAKGRALKQAAQFGKKTQRVHPSTCGRETSSEASFSSRAGLAFGS